MVKKFSYAEWEIEQGFPTSYRWRMYITPKSPQRVAQKPIFSFFGIKFNFNWIKFAKKFCCVKTNSGKVIQQSISYEITEKYGVEQCSH